MCSRTCASATARSRPPVALPVCTTTPSAPIARPRRSECRSDSTDRSTVAGVWDPKLIRYGACTYAGIEASAQAARNASSCTGLPAGVAQPRGLATKTCTVSAPRSRA